MEEDSAKKRKILSNIPTVSGTRASRAQEAAELDEEVKKQQMKIAREMARADFEKAIPAIRRNEWTDTRVRSAEELAEEETARIRILMEQRARRTLEMISRPDNNRVYNTYEERSYFTDHMTEEIMKDMKTKLSADTSTVASVAKSLRVNLKAALFGCDVHVGVCIDANSSDIVFVGENDYTRREQRGQSTVFECLDKKDIVVQALQRPRTVSAKRAAFSRGSLENGAADARPNEQDREKEAVITSGEAVVYVPLLGRRGGVGVIEIHGLFSDEITDPGRYERRTAALHGMILKQDFRFIHSLRLWRVPGHRLEYASEEQKAKFDRSDYHLVCGRIQEVVHTRNGVPFVGGAHYAIAWEDGWFEEAVSAGELLKIYAQTPASLGTNSQLDIKLISDFLKLGHATGVLVEKQRTKDALMLLQKKLYVPSLAEIDTFERTLDIALANVRGIRGSSIVVWDAMEHTAIELCSRDNPGNQPSNRSLTDIARVSVNSATPFLPEIVPEPGSDLVEWVVIELDVPEGYVWRNNTLQRRFFAIMIRLRVLSGKAAAAETQIFVDILQVLSKAISIKWERDQRTKHRKDLIRTTEGKLFEWKSMPMQDICHNTTLVAASVLPGANVYTGVLMPGADVVQFLASTPGSEMTDKELRRPSGVSFSVIENLETVVINAGDDKKTKYLQEGSLCKVYYGRKAFAGKIYKVRGHEKYDVEYLELRTYRVEAGVDISRIVPMHTAFKMKHLGGTFQTPYVCIPLRHRDKGLGVIGMDTIGGVPHAPYDSQPEYGLQKFLEQLGRILGTTIDLQRRKVSLKELTVVSQNVNSEIVDVLEATRKAITDNMYFAETVQICRVYYTTQEILSRGGPGVEMVLEWGAKNDDAAKRMESFHSTRSNQKSVQLHGDKNVWILLKLRGMTRMSKGKIYIISITQRIMPVTEPDVEFLGVLHKVLKSSMQSIDLKEEAGDSKTKALKEIKTICSDWRSMSRDALFAAVADHVNSVYLSANIYVGRLNAHGKEMQFFLASSRSKMAGKRLLRDPHKPPRVSITALDEVERRVVLPTMREANELHHFGPPESFEYPFVAVPLVAHVDAPVGILCGDACEDPSAGGEDTGEVLAFFGAVGIHMSEPVRGYSQQDATWQLKQIAQNFPTLRQGMREVKRVLLSVVPNALRVAEVEFEPRELRSMSTNDVIGAATVATTKSEYVVVIRVLSAKMHSDSSSVIKSPVVSIKWMGQEAYKCPVKRRMDTKPLTLNIPRGIPTSNLQCQIVLQGTIGGTIKEVSKKTLGLQYLSNVPLTTVEHSLDSSGSDTVVHVAKLSLSSKMFYSSQVVSIRLSTISIRGLAKADDYGLADPFVILFWNGVELTQTSVKKNNLDPTWTDLGIELRLDGKGPEECHLAMDVWDQDFLGRGDFLGRVELSGTDLNTLFVLGDDAVPTEDNPHPVTSDTYISLGRHPKLAEEAQGLVQGRMKLAGDAILAKDLTPSQMDAELDVLGKLEKDSAFEEEDEADAFAAFHECEVRVVAARGLTLGEDAVRQPSAFAVVKFNGEEVGRTAVMPESQAPEWEEETFVIRCPGGDKLENCVLSIDIMHAGLEEEAKAASSEEIKEGGNVPMDPLVRSGGELGRVEITGNALVGLVAATHFQSRWMDVMPPLAAGSKAKKSKAKKSGGADIGGALGPAEGYGGIGELLLGGKPINSAAETPAPVEAHVLELATLGVRPFESNKRHFNRVTIADACSSSIKYHTRILFNGKLIHRSGGVDEDKEWRYQRYLSTQLGDSDEEEEEEEKEGGVLETKETDAVGDAGEEGVGSGSSGGYGVDMLNRVLLPLAWKGENNHRAVLRVPNNRPLRDCVMEVQLWRSVQSSVQSSVAAGAGRGQEDEGSVLEKLGCVRLEGDELLQLSGKPTAQKRRWYPLVLESEWKATNEERSIPDGDLIQEIWLQGGAQAQAQGEERSVEHDADGRVLLLDIAATRCLPRRSEKAFVEVFRHPAHAYDQYHHCQVSPVVEVRWNGLLLGESVPVRNTANAEWTAARFTIEPPSIDGVPESLMHCRLELLVYDVGPGHVRGSAYAEAHTDAEARRREEERSPRLLVGSVTIEKEELVAFLAGPTYLAGNDTETGAGTEVSRWFPVNGPPLGSPEAAFFAQVDVDKALPYGEVKLHAQAGEGSKRLSLSLSSVIAATNGASAGAWGRGPSRVHNPHDCLEAVVTIVEAKGLAKPDAFSASNPYVLVEMDGREVYRSDEIKDSSDPQFHAVYGDAMRCVLRYRSLASILASYSHLLPENATNGHDRELRVNAFKALPQEERDLLEAARSGDEGRHRRRLVFSVYNHNVIAQQRDEFLGCHLIEGEEAIAAYFSRVQQQQAPSQHGSSPLTDTWWLEKSDELTPDENEFAQGQLVVHATPPARPLAENAVNTLRPAVLWIKGLKGLVNTKSFGSGSDVYMKVWRSFRAEGGRDQLLHTTQAVAKSCDPEYVDELVVVRVPSSEDERDWQGLRVRIEAWDITTGDFFGCAVLDGHLLYHRLHQPDSAAFTSSEMPLRPFPEELHSTARAPNGREVRVVGGDSAVAGSVEIAGGWKPLFDAQYKPQRTVVPKISVEDAAGKQEQLTEGEGEGEGGVAAEISGIGAGAAAAIDESGEACEIHILRAGDLPKADGMLGKSDPFCIVRWNYKEVGRTAVVPKDLNPVWDDERFRVNLAVAKTPLEAEAEAEAEAGEEKRDVHSPSEGVAQAAKGDISLESVLDIDVWDQDTMGAGDFLGKIRLTGKDLALLLDPDSGECRYPLVPSEELSPRSNKLATKGTITLEGHIVSVQRERAIRKRREEEQRRKKIEANPGLQASKVELHVQRASNLAKVSMRGAADAFFEVFWLEGKAEAEAGAVKDNKGELRGRLPTATTQVVKGSTNPVFDNEILTLEKPAGLRISETDLRLVCYHKGATGNQYMGEAMLTGAEIISSLPKPTRGVSSEPDEASPVTIPLRAFDGATAIQTKYVAPNATVTVSLKQMGEDQSIVAAAAAAAAAAGGGGKSNYVPPGMKEMQITVLAGSNLAKANTFGASDPYCVVKWAGREIGRTATIQETCDPVWGESKPETFTFIAPEDLGLPYHVKEAASIAEEEKKFRRLQKQLMMEGKDHSDAAVSAILEERMKVDNTAPPKDFLLSIDCYDWNALNSGIFLGSVELRGDELNDFAAGDRHRVNWFDLTRTRRLRNSEQSLVVTDFKSAEEEKRRARLELMLGPAKSSSAGGKVAGAKGNAGARVHIDEGETRLDIEVCAARGLAKADTFGSADPYVKVFWNNVKIGATSVISNNQNPVWEEEKFYGSFFTPPLELQDCSLYVEVWDRDLAGDGDFLGCVQLNGQKLRDAVEKTRYHPQWYPLTLSKMLPGAIQDLVQGEVEIRIGDNAKMAMMLENAQRFEFEVISAKGLARADGMFGLSDPYAIVKWNYTELGRTSYISKTLNPVWDTSNTFNLICSIDNDDENDSAAAGGNTEASIGQLNHLQVDVWDYDMVGNGKFLGCAIITGKDLDAMFKPSVLMDEEKTSTFGLALDPRRENQEGGITPKGTVEVKLRLPNESSGSLAQSINLKWESEREVAAGTPTIEIDIVKVNSLPITKVLQGKCNPMVVVEWENEEVGATSSGNACDYEWKADSAHFTLKIPIHAEINNSMLKLRVFDSDALRRGDFMGQVTIPFRGILRMQHGRFSMPLVSCEEYKNSYVRGNITFDMTFAYPYWDAIHPHSASKILRKITVMAAKNLPGINDLTPTTKGVISVEGLIKAKTQVSVKTSAPEWAPADCVVVVDMNKPIDVTIYVYHVDLAAKKEFAIGQYDIPFELLVRPPKAAFDVPLVPPTKAPPKKYRFQVGGQVRISLTTDNTVVDALRPFAFYHRKPDAALIARDVCPVTSTKKSKQDLLYDGEMLGHDELFWMGTVTDLSRVTTLATRPEWIVVPVHDPSQRVGYRAVDMMGTIPGRRLALAVQRAPDRHNISDAVMIDGIWREVDHCIAQLRRKEIYRELRVRALEKFSVFLQGVADKDDFDVHEVEKYIFDAIQTCCPGVRVYIGRVSPDFEHIRYTFWDSSGESRPFSVFRGMGSEWEFTGRHPPASLLVKRFSDFGIRRINTYTPFPTTSFPRVVAPLAAGDVSLGFFGVENLDIQRARLGESLTDEREMVHWLQEMGRLCGESIYTGKEKKALREMESYALSSGSTRTGVVVEILRACMNVLHGCKLMEVWSIDPNNRIKSLASQQPMVMPLPGRKVTVTSLNMKVLGGKGILGLVDDSSEEEDEEAAAAAAAAAAATAVPESEIGGDGEGQVGSGSSADGNTNKNKDKNKDKDKDKNTTPVVEPRKFTFLLGLRYDNVEQLCPVTISEKETKISVPVNMNFVLTFDRNIHITLYLVDKGLRTLRDWYGKVSFATFAEPSLKATLNRHKNVIPGYDASLALQWPDATEESSVNASAVDLKMLKLFNVNIKGARDLMGADGDTSDPFCEVHYNGKFIGKTKHVDKTLSPTFNERFAVPFTGEKGPLTLDIFDMSMIGKGAFLGQVEIPFDLLLTPPPGEFEYPLRMKKDLAARKQKYVGGMLTVEYDLELRKADSQVDSRAAKEASSGSAVEALEIPQSVWAMKTPSISLTVHSALNLAKANLFGGTSDPFVVIYLDYRGGGKGKKALSDDPIFKTKVIDNNLSPEWEENFIINLGVHMQQGVTTAKDFPTIRLEVFDYNNLMKGEFLGSCEVGPGIYFTMKHGEFDLGPSPRLNSRQNKLAQGELNLTFILQDNMADTRTNDFSLGKYGTLEGTPCVEVHIIRAKGLMVAKRLSGRSDPYVAVRWNGKDRGETTTKKGSLDPVWNNENFLVNLGEAGFDLPDLHMEIWDRDFFTGGEFMGEVVVPGEMLLHPPDSNAIESPLKPRVGETNPKIKGTLSYKLVSRYNRQALSFPPKEYVEVKTTSTASFNPMDVRVARDPEEEGKRQKFEKTHLPGLINKAKQDTNKYVHEPFSRSGIISEVHYGQIMSAVGRAQHTILKIDGRADIVCIPASSDEVTAAATAAAGGGGGGDENKGKNKRGASGGKKGSGGAESKKRSEDLLYMIARYENGQTPRRDIKFLTKFQSILVRGLKVATNRKDRVTKRQALEANMAYITEHTKHLANDVIVHGLVEVESGISATCEMYALLPDGKTFAVCSKARGDPDISSEKANDFVMLAARLCRHGFMLQYFRGQMLLCDWSWVNTSQLAMVPLESIAEQIDDVEGEGYVHILLDVAKSYAPDGGWVVPLIGENESMMAVLYVKDLDKLPYAAYRIRRLEDEAKRKKFEADKAAGKASAKRRKDHIECFGPEEGVAHSLRETGRGLGIALLKARMGDAIRKMRTFPITHETTLVDVLRNAFRVLVVAVPTIRGISIWGVDMSREPKLRRPKAQARQLNFIERLKRALGLLPSAGIEEEEGKSKSIGKNEGEEEEEEEDRYQKREQLGFPEVCCGYFGSESPDNLLHTHLQIMRGEVKVIEKKTFADISDEDVMAGRKLEVKTEKQTIVTGSRRSSAITDQHMLAKRKKMLQSMSKTMAENEEVPSIDWTVGVPFALHKPAKKNEEGDDSESDSDDDQKEEEEEAFDTFQKEERAKKAKKKAEKRRRREQELREEGKTRDCSYATALEVVDTAKIHSDAMAVVHAECKRCLESLERTSFRVVTGNVLSWVGREDETKSSFDALFGMKVPPKGSETKEEKEEEEGKKGEGEETAGIENPKADISPLTTSSQPLGGLTELVEEGEEEEDSDSSPSASPRSSVVSPRPAGVSNAPAMSRQQQQQQQQQQQRPSSGSRGRDKPTAPLPPGPAPGRLGAANGGAGAGAGGGDNGEANNGAIDLLADLDDDTKVSAEAAARAALDRKKKEEAREHVPKLSYFLSVNSHGIGGEYGYGTLGDQFVELLGELGQMVDDDIRRIAKAVEKKRKDDEEAERQRLEAEAEKKRKEEEEEQERLRKEEEKRKRRELNARLRGNSGSDSDGGGSSDGSRGKGGRRGSVAGRRGSVAGRRASVSGGGGRRASVSQKAKK